MLAALSALVLSLALLTPTVAEAAVSCALLTASHDTTNNSTHSTASVTPTANALVLVFWRIARNGANEAANMIISFNATNNLTYVEAVTIPFSAAVAPTVRISAWRAMGAAPSAGALTATYGGNTQTSASWAVVECTGVDTSGTNGSGAVVQTDSDESLASTSTDAGLSLAAFGSANNATIMACAIDTNNAITGEGGYTELSDTGTTDGGGGLDFQLATEFIAANDTTPTASWASSDAGCVALELKAAASTRRAQTPMVLN